MRLSDFYKRILKSCEVESFETYIQPTWDEFIRCSSEHGTIRDYTTQESRNAIGRGIHHSQLVRGILVGNQLIIWNALHAAHFSVWDKIIAPPGVQKEGITIQYDRQNQVATIHVSEPSSTQIPRSRITKTLKWVAEHPQLKKLFSKIVVQWGSLF